MVNILLLGDDNFFEETFFEALDELDATLMQVSSMRPYFEGVDGYTPDVIMMCFSANRLKDYDQRRFRGQQPHYTGIPVVAVFDMIGWEDIGRVKVDLNATTVFIMPVNEVDLLDRIEALW